MTLSTTFDETAIKKTIARYFDALNHSDVDAALTLYTDDPVMLPFLQPTVVRREAVRQNYEGTFQHIQFGWKRGSRSWWRCLQSGPTYGVRWTVHTGHHSKGLFGHVSRFHELSSFQNEQGEWRIARYSFSPTAELPA
ncbi:YybH family protein [Acidisarcina polymorpha]|uniref:YybH family protein n=1 Tax=Acidisarcina polymorpha TaxID=2211140 RepID=UPI003083F8EA